MTCEEADTTFKLDASLQKRIEARTEERNKKRAEQDELKDPTENQFEFNAKFRQAVSALEAQIAPKYPPGLPSVRMHSPHAPGIHPSGLRW